MSSKEIQLRIDTPTGSTKSGRGFYQLDEESLFVQIGLFSEKKHFFNYLENENILLDLDRTGQLIFIEVYKAKRHWKIIDNLKVPQNAEVADIRWLNFREKLPNTEIQTDAEQKIVKVQLSENISPLYFILANNVIAETDQAHKLTALWITAYDEDAGGKAIKQFRRKERRAGTYLD